MRNQVAQDARGETVKFSGSTAVVCIIRGPKAGEGEPAGGAGAATLPTTLFVANVGDSRAVLSRRGIAIEMSTDQVPSRPDERKRIEVRGRRERDEQEPDAHQCLSSTS